MREFQNLQKIRIFWKILSTRSGHFGNLKILENFRNFRNPPKFPKNPPLCFGKSYPLSRAILEILEIRKVRVKIFGNFGHSRKERKFQNFQKSALIFWNILYTRSGHFENFGAFQMNTNTDFTAGHGLVAPP